MERGNVQDYEAMIKREQSAIDELETKIKKMKSDKSIDTPQEKSKAQEILNSITEKIELHRENIRDAQGFLKADS
jgi:hypothetical protein